MSHSLPALQENALRAADAFCQRYIPPPKKKQRRVLRLKQSDTSNNQHARKNTGAFYQPRDHAASPFFKIVRDNFEKFEEIYPERYQERYGYWRPVIRTSIDKFLKCGDLKEGFARVRCPDCKEEFFVAFSCRQRGCCPSCDKKRSLVLAHRLNEDVLADVPHRQWVFTIPKRLRVYFRYDRSLLGKLCRAAYDTVCEVFKLEIDGECGIPAMIGAVQTFGDLIHFHPHIHTIVAEGVFTESGHFVHIPDIWIHRAEKMWQERVFSLLLDEYKINKETVVNMQSWKHTGFSVNNSVQIKRGDKAGMQRLTEYITRCPFSLTGMVTKTEEGKIVYRASHANCIPFPLSGDATLMAGIPRNFEVFDPLDFLAEVTQHIPNKGEHQIKYYGFYSNKRRGMQKKKDPKVESQSNSNDSDTPYRKKCRITWAMLIKAVFEVDPLKCPQCGGTMKIVSFVEEPVVIRKILKHCNLWKDPPRPPPLEIAPHKEECDPQCDYSFFDDTVYCDMV
jgi:hypothetical protein